MDEARTTLLAVASSLSRLLIRLHDLSNSVRRRPGGHVTAAAHAHWTVSDLSPPSAWLDAAAPNTAISGAISSVMLAQAHLLAMIEAPGDVDLKLAIRALEHVCHGAHWSARVEAISKRLGVELPESPSQFHHGASLHQVSLPRRGERHSHP